MVQLLEKSIIDPQIGFHYAFTPFPRLNSEPHWHDFYEFFITFDDDVYHNVNGSKQFLPEGSLVLIRPRDSHSFEYATSANCNLMNIAFAESTFQLSLIHI